MSRQRIARNVGALTVARGGTMLLKLGVAAHLARVLEPAGLGVLGFSTALVSYLALFGTLGLDVLGTRAVAREPEDAAGWAASVVGLRLALSVGLYVLYGVGLTLLPVGAVLRAVLLIQGLTVIIQAADVEWLYRGVERMTPVATRNLAADALQLAGMLLLVRSPDDLITAVWVSTASLSVVAGGMWVSYRKDFGALRLRLDPDTWRRLLRPALPLTASALMIAVYYNSDRLLLGWLRTAAEVGHYEVAYRLMGVIVAPSQILGQAFFPSLASASGDAEAMRRRGRDYASVMVAVGLPLAAVVAVGAGPLVRWFAGDEYAASALPLMILSASAAAVYVNSVLGQALLAWDDHRPYVVAVTAGAVANVALNVVVIPRFGVPGAAVTTFLAEAVAMIWVARAYRRLAGELPWQPAVRALVVAALSALSTWGAMHVGAPPLLALAAGGLAALAASAAVGTVSPAQIRALRAGRGGPA